MKKIKINGNVMTLEVSEWFGVLEAVSFHTLENFSVQRVDQTKWTVSFPMTSKHHSYFAAHIHRHNSEQRAKNPHLDPKGPGPKGTPPTGGTPGAARVTKFENTVAIAA